MTTTTISLPNIEFSGHFQTPAKVGAKTITLDVNYTGCTVSIARTNENYFSIVARTGLRGMDVVAAQVHYNTVTNVWSGDYFDMAAGEYCYIGQSTELDEMLHAAANNVSWRGHELNQW
jgi:hypothetical protein